MYTQSPKQGFKKFQPLVIVNLVAFPPFNASPCGPSYKVSYGLDFFFFLWFVLPLQCPFRALSCRTP